MAKITIAGDAVVVTSAMKFDELMTIKKYRPSALVLKGGEDGKEPIFAISVNCGGRSTINKYGAEFASATHDDAGLAAITQIFECNCSDIKQEVADTIGAYVLNLNKLEETLPAVLDEIEAEKQKIMDNISVVGSADEDCGTASTE